MMFCESISPFHVMHYLFHEHYTGHYFTYLLLNHTSALYSPSRSFPILIYFKETQTPEENWNIGPGEQANSPEAIAKGAGKQLLLIPLHLA